MKLIWNICFAIGSVWMAFVIYSANQNGVNRAQEQRQAILNAQNNLDLSRGPVAIKNFRFNPQLEYTSFVEGFLSTADIDTLARALPAPLDVEAVIRSACQSNRAEIVELCRDIHNLTVEEARAQGNSNITMQGLNATVTRYVENEKYQVVISSIRTDMGIYHE